LRIVSLAGKDIPFYQHIQVTLLYYELSDYLMKSLPVILTLLFLFQVSRGQDIITTKDKKQLNVKVIEQTIKTVRYKMPDYEDGPVLMIKANRIRKIEYGNGYTDLMGYQNPRKSLPLGVSMGYGTEVTAGGGLVSATADYFLIPQMDLEINFGASDLSGGLYYSAGSRFHLNSRYSEHRLTPFTGILAGNYYGDGILQVPAGINYITGMGISASLSVNEMVSFESWQVTFIELRIGWRFRVLPSAL
jgi:hypothetical protein